MLRRLRGFLGSGPEAWRLALLYDAARCAVRLARTARTMSPEPSPLPGGISVVIPSRNGRPLLEAQLPGLIRELAGFRAEIIVVDNGSDDGTRAWLEREYPSIAVDESPAPLSFARAVNRGIRRARYSHVFLLNNDMILESGFFAPLVRAFDAVPDLFCATAQIFFPPGARREETGKAVITQPTPEDFPVRCEEPLPGEDLSWVLYGSGGCSLYDAAKLRFLGCVNEIFEPAYVEDLDLGYRAWQRGWPSIFACGARLEHRHRATTSRYFTAAELDRILEINYLRFLATAVSSPTVFRRLWRQAIYRLKLQRNAHALASALGILASAGHVPEALYREDLFLALTSGDVAVFPGHPARGTPVLLEASACVPIATPHGSASAYDRVLVAFSEHLATPGPETLACFVEIVLVRRREGGASTAFRAALQQTVRKWRPGTARLEGAGMAQYAGDCAPAVLR
ncbi:MAG TPA: glycosyltransferase [Bryobacteraceae bacterium]|nr:glycosyltransferase [Bryobacteraceae bacterium]